MPIKGEHEISKDCVCNPILSPMRLDDGSIAKVYLHQRFEGDKQMFNDEIELSKNEKIVAAVAAILLFMIISAIIKKIVD